MCIKIESTELHKHILQFHIKNNNKNNRFSYKILLNNKSTNVEQKSEQDIQINEWIIQIVRKFKYSTSIESIYYLNIIMIKRKEHEEDQQEEVSQDQQQQQQEEDQNNYEQDDFVVDDNSNSYDEESDYKDKKKKKAKKLKRKYSEEQLDQEDINLIQENQKATRNNRKRLKKNKPDLDDQELFQPDKHEDSALKEQQEEDFDENQDEPQMSDINENFEIKNKIQDIFEPGGLDEYYIKKEDQLIVQTDIPERLQLKFKGRSQQKDLKEQLFQEAKWIFEKMKQRFDERKYGVVKQKIYRVLELIRNENCQVMYIYYYKRLVYAQELNLEYLWKIYQLDEEWAIVKQMKKELAQETIPFLTSSGIEINQSISRLLQEANDIKTLKILKQYTEFELSKRKIIKKDKRKLPTKSNLVAEVFEHGIVKWNEKQKIFLSPAKLYENIRQKVQKHKCYTPEVPIRVQLQKFMDKKKNLFSQSTIIPTVCRYLELQLFSYPDLRRWIKQKYHKKIVVSTVPTKKGEQDINLYSPFFPVKRIVKKPITSFRGDTWLLIRQAQKLDLVRSQMMFEWQLNSTAKNYQSDQVYKDLTQFYVDHTHHTKSDILDYWNLFRREVIVKLINNNIVPSLHRQIKQDLYKEAQKEIIQACCQKFRYQLNKGPSVGPDGKKLPIILALVLQHEKLGIAIVDQDGNLRFKGVIKISFESSIEYVVRGKALNEYIQEYKPDLIVISANCRQSITLRKELRATKLLRREAKEQFCALGEYELCSLIAKREIMKGSNEQLVILEATSLARLKLNGMAEILNMWSEKIQDNGVLFMNLHQSQKLVNQHKLKSQLERVAVQMVNLVGINLNQLKQCPHLQKQLQFVSGLGPRKSLNFLEKLKILEEKEIKRRRLLLSENIVGKTVYKNCSGFFKITTKAHTDFLENAKVDKKSLEKQQISLLQLTRIHDQHFSLVLRIAVTAVADGPRKKNIDEQQAVAELLRNSNKIRNVEFDQNLLDKEFISTEFAQPFKDPREPERPIQNREAFFSILRETPETLKKYMIFSVKIIGVAPHHLTVKITQNGLLGWIRLPNENKIQYKKQSIIKALILRFPFDPIDDKKKHNEQRHEGHQDQQLLKVEMALNFPHSTSKPHNCLTDCFQNITKQIHPRIDLQHFNLKKEDMPVLQTKEEVRGRTQLRLINHPKFKNIGITQAIEWLNSEPIGEFIIRPSTTKGKDYLTITWKFFEGVITHIGVKVETRMIGTLSFQYKIQQRDRERVYNSFDEIIENYIKPMNRIMQDVVSNRKFIPMKLEEIQSKIKVERQKDPNLIHYYFGCSADFPQFVILVYMPKENRMVREHIKIKDCGLVFHEQIFPSLKELISWFKSNFKEKDYQKYVPKPSQTVRR